MLLHSALLRTSSAVTAPSSRRLLLALIPRATLSTTSDETLTGRVKFYNRNKAYGFITPDDESVGDVFVHRHSIVGDSEAKDDVLHFPYLRTFEKVRFTIEEAGRDKPLARNVTYEDGTLVPTVRPYYAKGVAKGAKARLGSKVFDIMSADDASSTSPEELLDRVRVAYNNAKDRIDRANKLGEAADDSVSGESAEESESEQFEQEAADDSVSGESTEESESGQSR